VRENRAIERRIKKARFPVLKTMEDFEWGWPKKINRPQIQNLFRLAFIPANTNIVFISTVGLGKTHISLALGHAACIAGHSVLFTTAVDIINTLAAAQAAARLKREIGRYMKPDLLIIDELGYLPIDKHGADLLFQIISQRYERAPMVITTNRAYKYWAQIFNNDSTLTSAILDRVLHHVDTVVIEGKSFRTKKRDRRVRARCHDANTAPSRNTSAPSPMKPPRRRADAARTRVREHPLRPNTSPLRRDHTRA
jgi:DNA replication protein DnaC